MIASTEVSKYVEREILNHKRLIHPHIVQLKEVPCSRVSQASKNPCRAGKSRPQPAAAHAQVFLTNNHLAIAMEYAAGGNLYQLVARSGGLPEPDARWYFQQLIFAIDYCHKMVRRAGGPTLCCEQPQSCFSEQCLLLACFGCFSGGCRRLPCRGWPIAM
jgi:serine/threonine protein kinase